jgi:hypothetical protein
MKKGMALKYVGEAILVLAVVAVVLFIFARPAGLTADYVGSQLLKGKRQACLLTKEQNPDLNLKYCGHPDHPVRCSICIGATKEQWDDVDDDGMIDECEKEEHKNNPQKNACNYYYSKYQCCTTKDPCPGITCTDKRPS